MPVHDTLKPADVPLVVFGHQFDTLAAAVRDTREQVRRLENQLVQARDEARRAEDACNTYVSKALYG